MNAVSGRLSNVRRVIAMALVVVGLPATTLLAVPLVTVSASSALTVPPYWVSATPTSGLIDGQRVTITIKSDPTFPIYQVEARVCRAGVTYQPSSGNRPNADFELGGLNCPSDPITSSADVTSVDANVLTQAQTDKGNPMSIRVGAGTTSWPVGNPTSSITCDSENPCTLVVEILGGPGATWVPWTTTLTYRIDDPVLGCGGPADGAITSGGSDRITDAWVAWTLAECHRPGRLGAAAKASFVGEGSAIENYRAGLLDLGYTAAGDDATVGLIAPDSASKPRASVPVPIALNATVIAVAGGFRQDGQKLNYGPIKLTMAEAASLIGGGTQSMSPFLNEITKRNPELGASFFDYSSSVQIAAYADAEATSYFGSQLFSTQQREAFRVPDQPTFGSDAGKYRGADSNFALADPSYAGALNLLTGRSSLSKTMTGISPSSSGGVWFLTDQATAQSLGLTTVELENANGVFVGPTPESMAAAVPTMKTDAQGYLLPDPNANVGPSEVQPYPLTFVEYALAPTTPLADSNNVCRTNSQTMLVTWLNYLTGPGQSVLPAGFQPLTPSLLAQASAAVQRVGVASPASPCTGSASGTSTTTTTIAPVVASADTATNYNNSYSPSQFSTPRSSAGLTSGPGTVVAKTDNVTLAAARGPVPDYVGGSLANRLSAGLAIVGIIVMTAFAALATSRRLARSKFGRSTP